MRKPSAGRSPTSPWVERDSDVNEKWSDFEKFVFKELGEIKKEVFTLKGRASAWGAIAGVAAAGIMEALSRAFR